MPSSSDPPIIVTGGGGDRSPTPGKRAAKNYITIDCDPENPTGPKKFRTKSNKDAEIESMMLEFPDMPGQEPIIISGYDVYRVKITFNTAEVPKSPVARKKEKTPAKRPAARKKSK